MLPRNDPRHYDELAEEWWKPAGAFAALHWLARARAALIPPGDGRSLLLDLGCGGGLLRPHVRGYRYVGVDLNHSALLAAAGHGVTPVRGDVEGLPVRDGTVDVAVAGELFEHVDDLDATVAEAARVLRTGGLLVSDTINDTRTARLTLVTLGERLPGGPPPGIHDPQLFVAPRRLAALFRRHGIEPRIRGLRPAGGDYLRFVCDRRRPVRLVPTRILLVYQAWGRKVL